MFCLIFVIQVYHKLIVSEKVGSPPLNGEVAFHHVSDEMTEGSAVEEPNCSFSMYWHKRLNYKHLISDIHIFDV